MDRNKLNFEFEKYVLLGGSGVLGKALSEAFNEKIILKTSRAEIDSWLGSGGFANMNRYFTDLGEHTTVINALGITDPNVSIEQLEYLNYFLPKQILTVVNELGIKLITFGTILERFPTLASNNSYVRTKQYFLNLLQNVPSAETFLHLQLHTIYGSERAHSHMFIEQIFHSLRNKTEFVMSSGLQMREYHHIDDEIKSIKHLIETGSFGVLELNAGNAIPIILLARRVFEEFDQTQLLKIDPSRDVSEVFNHFYQKTPQLEFLVFRDPILGVIDYLRYKLSK